MMQQRISVSGNQGWETKGPNLTSTADSDWRPRVLVTGFGPFPGVPENVTSSLVPDLAGRAREAFPASNVRSGLLPTEWQGAPETLHALLAEFRPSIVILFGVSGQARGFEVEAVARNRVSLSADAIGMEPLSARLDPVGAEQIAVRFPVARVVARLRQRRLPARISRDAGSYLCNATLHHLLGRQDLPETPRIAGFVHVPSDLRRAAEAVQRRAQPFGLTYENTLAGMLDVLAVCLGQTVPGRGFRAKRSALLGPS